jgi:hypothetical protein
MDRPTNCAVCASRVRRRDLHYSLVWRFMSRVEEGGRASVKRAPLSSFSFPARQPPPPIKKMLAAANLSDCQVFFTSLGEESDDDVFFFISSVAHCRSSLRPPPSALLPPRPSRTMTDAASSSSPPQKKTNNKLFPTHSPGHRRAKEGGWGAQGARQQAVHRRQVRRGRQALHGRARRGPDGPHLLQQPQRVLRERGQALRRGGGRRALHRAQARVGQG